MTQYDIPTLSGIPIPCLFYADDLVLISKSEEGLQNLINVLHKFAERWGMTLNMTKTKCVVFSRKKHLPIFYYNNIPIINSEFYVYLGMVLKSNGSLKEGIKVLEEKAKGAMFGLTSKIFKYQTCTFKSSCRMFDTLVKPILLYNCEVWGACLLPKNIKSLSNILDIALKCPTESTHLKFLKYFLGLNKRTSNWGTISETGRFPFMLFIFTHMVKFWWHMMNTNSHILRGALQENFKLYLAGNNTWMKSLARILKFIDADHILYTTDTSEVLFQLKSLKVKLEQKFLSCWREHTENTRKNSESKLTLFASLLNKFQCAPHILAISNYKLRCSFSRFRLSAHRLPIETLRYSNVPRSLRLCPFCCKAVGDETHYMLHCTDPQITESRENILGVISELNTNLSPLQKTMCLLNEGDPNKAALIGRHIRLIDDLFKKQDEY